MIWQCIAICLAVNSSTNQSAETQIFELEFAEGSYKIGQVVGALLHSISTPSNNFAWIIVYYVEEKF